MSVTVGYDVFTVAMNTGTGAQALVGDCKGHTPKAALVYATRAVTLGTAATGALMSIGFTDGTNHRCSSSMSEDGQLAAAADTGRNVSGADLIQTTATTAEPLVGQAQFSSFSADTLNINISAAPATAVLLVVVLFYGDDLQAAVGTLAASATQDVAVSASGLAFRPRVVFGLGAIGGFAAAAAAASRITFGWGVLNDDGTVQGQAGTVWYDRDRPATSTTNANGMRTDSFQQRITAAGFPSVATEESRYEITAGTADGFTVTTRAGNVGLNIGYLALFTSTLRAWSGIPAIATGTTGNKSITSPGFKPQALFSIGSQQTANDTYDASANAIHIGFGAQVARGGGCVAYQAEQAAASSTRSYCAAQLAAVVTAAGAIDWAATWVSFDPLGFTVNIGTASPAGAGGTDRIAPFLALEESGKAPGWFDARSGHRWRRNLARR